VTSQFLLEVVLDADIRVIDNAHMKSDRLHCQREVGHGVSRDWIKINVKFAVDLEETSEKDVLIKVLEQLRRTCSLAARSGHADIVALLADKGNANISDEGYQRVGRADVG
jgi:hypothetical protein